MNYIKQTGVEQEIWLPKPYGDGTYTHYSGKTLEELLEEAYESGLTACSGSSCNLQEGRFVLMEDYQGQAEVIWPDIFHDGFSKFTVLDNGYGNEKYSEGYDVGYVDGVSSVHCSGYTQEDLDAAYASGWSGGYSSGYTDGLDDCVQSGQTGATSLTWEFYDDCSGEWTEYPNVEASETVPSRVIATPSGADVNLVYSVEDSSVLTIDSAGTIVGGSNCFQETTITVRDTISNLSITKEVFVDCIPYSTVLEPNDCPCGDISSFNDCGCVPASGGTYHNEMVFNAPWRYGLSEVNLISKPDWVTVLPVQETGCGLISLNLTFTVAENSGSSRYGDVVFQGNDISGLTCDFRITQEGVV